MLQQELENEQQVLAEFQRRAAEGPAILNRYNHIVDYQGFQLELDVIQLNPFILQEFSRESTRVYPLTPELMLVQQAAIDDGRYIMGYIGQVRKTGNNSFTASYFFTQAKSHDVVLGGMLAAEIPWIDVWMTGCGFRFPGKSMTNRVTFESETIIQDGVSRMLYICTFDGESGKNMPGYIDRLVQFTGAVHEGISMLGLANNFSEVAVACYQGDPNGISLNVRKVML